MNRMLLLLTALSLSAGTALAQTPPSGPSDPPSDRQSQPPVTGAPSGDAPGGVQPPPPPPAPDENPPTPLPGLDEPPEPPAPDAAAEPPQMAPPGATPPGMGYGGMQPGAMPMHMRHHGMYRGGHRQGASASIRMRAGPMEFEVQCGADPIAACVEAVQPLLDKAMERPRGPRDWNRMRDRDGERGWDRDDDDRRGRDRDREEDDDRDRDDWDR
jgi:hypothetical protein